jgi:hypothetical protein
MTDGDPWARVLVPSIREDKGDERDDKNRPVR